MFPLIALLAVTALWAAVVAFFWHAKAWLPYYVIGASGAAVLLVVFARDVVPLELALRAATARSVDAVSGLLGMHTSLSREPGSIMVVAVPHHSQWTLLRVGLESSGLLESATLVGLIAFFPNGSWRRRALLVTAAVAASFVANVLRVLVIVTSITLAGQDSLDVAHVFLGRILFFAMALAIYWFAITRPTLRTVHRRVHGAPV